MVVRMVPPLVEKFFVGDVQLLRFREQVLPGNPVRLEQGHHMKRVADRVVRDGVELHAFGGPESVCGHAFGEESREDARAFDACTRHFEVVARKKHAGVDAQGSGQALEKIDAGRRAVVFDIANLRRVDLRQFRQLRLRNVEKFAISEHVCRQSIS